VHIENLKNVLDAEAFVGAKALQPTLDFSVG
jgi:hypothetical protein